MDKKIEGKSILKKLRKIRDKISLEIMDLSKEEIKEYFANKRTLHPKMYKTE